MVDDFELFLGVFVSLVEEIVVLWFSIWVNLDLMFQDGLFAVVSAVVALLLDVVDGHENLRQFWHSGQFFGLHFLRFGVQLNDLYFDFFVLCIVLRNVVVDC